MLAFRVMLSLLARHPKWCVVTTDAESAFLHRLPEEDCVAVRPPLESRELSGDVNAPYLVSVSQAKSMVARSSNKYLFVRFAGDWCVYRRVGPRNLWMEKPRADTFMTVES